MKNIKLWFTDFYEGFDPADNPLSRILEKNYSIILTKEEPDYLIYSCYGNEFLNYNCIRIYYTGENLTPDFNLCDYAIGFDRLTFRDRYLRYPNYAFFEDQFEQLINPRNFDKKILSEKKYFCNFIYSNPHAHPARDHFFHKLNSYKEVTSLGTHLNNSNLFVGERFAADWMFSKLEFQSQCKFTIAFENTSSPGYTTEKILHAFISNTIPIYWGDPEVTKDFNPHSFINCHDFEDFEAVMERIREIDGNDELYLSILNEPPYVDNKIPEELERIKLTDFLQHIFDQEKEVAGRRNHYGTSMKYENDLKAMVALTQQYKERNKLKRFLDKLGCL